MWIKLYNALIKKKLYNAERVWEIARISRNGGGDIKD